MVLLISLTTSARGTVFYELVSFLLIAYSRHKENHKGYRRKHLWFVIHSLCSKQLHGPEYNYDRKKMESGIGRCVCVSDSAALKDDCVEKPAFEHSVLTKLNYCGFKHKTKLILLHSSLSLSRLKYGAMWNFK